MMSAQEFGGIAVPNCSDIFPEISYSERGVVALDRTDQTISRIARWLCIKGDPDSLIFGAVQTDAYYA